MEEMRKHKELDKYFKDMNHSDIKTIVGNTDLRHFIAGMISYYPWWIRLLYKVRKILVKILGLTKHEIPVTVPNRKPEDISFKPGDNSSLFIVRSAKEDTYLVAETPEDRHLQAFLGVVAEKLPDGRTRFHVFTTVKYLHWSGPVYFNLIRPFHHFVAWRMMKAGIRYSKRHKPG